MSGAGMDRMAALRARAALARAVRGFFEGRGFLEVETRCAVRTPGEEVHLRAFETAFVDMDGSRRALWLRTSPEFAIKRLLAEGSGPVFELARVWRNGEASETHAPEFTMLEYYAPGVGFDGLIALTEALLVSVLPARVRCRGMETALDRGFERLTVAEAFARYAGVDVLEDPEDAVSLARRAGVRLREGEGWEDLFFRLMLERVEPRLGRERPTVLTHWPAQQAALARRDPADSRVALRFELYVCGIELVNAFEELTDPVEQRVRFEADRARRASLSPVAGPVQDWPLDEALLSALGRMPATSGAALGFDRLAMIATGADRVSDVQWGDAQAPFDPQMERAMGSGLA